MIENERQYRITRAQTEKFERELARLSESPSETAIADPIIRKAMEDAVRSQLSSLRAELQEYESLQEGGSRVLELTSLDELPVALIQARIAAGMSQRDLAKRLGLREEQIQRYEATGYATVSLDRVKEVIEALGVRVLDVRLSVTSTAS